MANAGSNSTSACLEGQFLKLVVNQTTCQRYSYLSFCSFSSWLCFTLKLFNPIATMVIYFKTYLPWLTRNQYTTFAPVISTKCKSSWTRELFWTATPLSNHPCLYSFDMSKLLPLIFSLHHSTARFSINIIYCLIARYKKSYFASYIEDHTDFVIKSHFVAWGNNLFLRITILALPRHRFDKIYFIYIIQAQIKLAIIFFRTSKLSKLFTWIIR